MADYGRYREDQIRDRESGRYGRDMSDARGGWGRGRDDHDRSRESSRGGGMFGSGSDWDRAEKGWGREGSLFGGARSHGEDRDRQRGSDSWGGGFAGWGGESSRRDRDHDRTSGGWGGESMARERSSGGWGGEGSRSSHEQEQRGRDFGYDDRHEGLPIDETSRLIGSNKVEGTAVYGRDGRRMGSIFNFMVDKRSGKVEYAVMTYGGFLGMGTRYYPMPWDILTYDTRLGGYRVEMTERDLERAPSFDRSNEPNFDRGYDDRVRGWYGLGR